MTDSSAIENVEIEKKARIVMVRWFKDEPPTIFRGRIISMEDQVFKIVGRRFAKVLEHSSNRAEEKPLDAVDKTYVIPVANVRFAEVIEHGSPEDELDERIKQEPLLRRKGSQALID